MVQAGSSTLYEDILDGLLGWLILANLAAEAEHQTHPAAVAL